MTANDKQMLQALPADVSWKHYIAQHPECTRIVGSGITRAQLMFVPDVHDPNRGGQLRLDYVFENLEGVRCKLHPTMAMSRQRRLHLAVN